MSYVYFIQSGTGKDAPIKIGVAKNVNKRLEILQIGNPDKLTVITAIKADNELQAYWLEKNLHKFFKSDCIRGEWFRKINMKKAESICATRPLAKESKNSAKKERYKDIEGC